MAEETTRVPPASPMNKATSLRSASPRTGTTRVPPASPMTETIRRRSASPRTGTTRVPPASPTTETTRQRSASPRTGTTRVPPGSPMTETIRRRSASPKTETTQWRSASPRTETNRVQPPSQKMEAIHVAPTSPRNKLRGGGNPRSFEISPGSSTSDGKLIPNYLRAPSGSCHDLCKHGTRQICEVKESRPSHKSVKGNGPDIVNIKEYKAVTASDVNETTSSTAEKEKQEILVPTDSFMVVGKEISSNAKDMNFSKTLSITSKVNPSSRSPSPISKGGSSADRSTAGRKNVDGSMSLDGRRTFERRKSPDQAGSRSLGIRKSPDGKKNIGMRTGVCSSSAENNGEGNKNSDDKTFPATNDSEYDTGFNLESKNKDEILGNSKNDAEKHIAAPKPKIVKMKPLPSLYPSALKPPSPVHPLSGVRSNKSGDNQLPGKISTPRVDAKKVGTTSTKFPSSRSSVNGEESTITKKVGFIRVVSSTRKESKVTTVKEKDPNEQDSQEDSAGSVKIPPGKESPARTKVKAKSSITLIPPVLSVSKSTIRSRTSYVPLPPHPKKPPVGSKSKNSEKDTPSLRKSKAVDGVSGNHGPSIANVRKTSLPRETSQFNRPSLRTRDVAVRGRDLFKSSNSSSGSILYKYPSIGRKKKGQVLFNKVIEETAKRLVRTRKSKVLALVGAFETVISIQKKKSSAAARPKVKKISSFKKLPH